MLVTAVAAAQSQTPLPKAPTDVKPGSITYDEVPYPYPVSYLPLTMYGQDVRMAYMDIPPAGSPNGRVVVLFQDALMKNIGRNRNPDHLLKDMG